MCGEWRSIGKRTDLWAADVGQDTWEEINVIDRGGNYGWNIREGFKSFTTTSQPPPAPPPAHVVGNLIDPIFAYNHSIGKAIIGGCVYRGNKVPELRGAYLFADYVGGQVYVLRFDETVGSSNFRGRTHRTADDAGILLRRRRRGRSVLHDDAGHHQSLRVQARQLIWLSDRSSDISAGRAAEPRRRRPAFAPPSAGGPTP